MDQLTYLGIIAVFFCLVGFYLAYLYGRKTKQFRWSEYLAIIVWPLLCVLALAYFVDVKILTLFFASAFIGFVLEYVLGLTYHKTLNKKLWHYERLSVGGYTSLLSIPIWGVVGVVFWSVGEILGL
jgi:uncharacterized membrane protein